MSTVSVEIASDRLDPVAIQQKVVALATDVTRHVEATAEVPAGTHVENTRGEPITLGMLLVTFMTSGAAVALLEVVKAHLERDRRISISLEAPDGSRVTLDAANMADSGALAEALLSRAFRPRAG